MRERGGFWGELFSEGALRGLEGYVLGLVGGFVGVVRGEVERGRRGGNGEEEGHGVGEGEDKGWSRPLDMRNWCNWLVFDIMGDLVSRRDV